MPDLSNPQGLNPQQMGTAAGGSPSPADTVKAAQAAPGTLQTGATTGTTAPGQGIAPIATTFQAKTAANPPLISPTANQNVLSSSDATAYTNGVRGQLDTQQADLNKRSADLQGTIQQRAQAAFDASKKTIETNLQPEKENMASSERSADLTATAANVKSGVAGTDYGKDVIGELTDKHLQEQNIFNQKEQKLLSDAWDSALRGSIGEVAQAQKELSDLGTQRDKAAQDYYKNQTDALNLEKLSTGAADTTINRMLTGGFAPSSDQLLMLDRKYNLDPGTSQTLYAAATATKAITDAKDANTQQTAAVDAAKKLTDYLDSRPTGEPVQIGNNTYYGTGKAGLKTGVEIDKTTGQGLAYSYDPSTGRTTVTPMGTVGFENDGNWSIEKADDGTLWRVNAGSGKMLPMTPGSHQVTNNAVLPEGSTPPALPGHETNAGQCGAYANFCYGSAILGPNGNTFTGKQAALSAYPTVDPKSIQSGNTFLMDGYGSTGHIGFVGDPVYDSKGKLSGFMADESNFVPPGGGKVSYSRFVSIDDPHLKGFYDVPTPNKPPVGGDSPVTQAANGNYPTFGAKAASDKILSPAEAKDLGVPYGTTQSQAASKNIIPGRPVPGQPLTADQESAANDLANYTADMKTITAGRSGNEREALLTRAKEINPNFDAKQYTIRQNLQKDFTSGDASNAISAITKAVEHIKDLKASGDTVVSKRFAPYGITALQGHVPGFSVLGDAAANITGTAGDLKAYNLNATAVADELTKVFRGTGGSEKDVQAFRDGLNDRNTASENKLVIQKGVDLMAGQIKGLFEKYVRGMGKAPDQPIISQQDIEGLKQIGVDTTKLERYAASAPQEPPPNGEMWVADENGKVGSVTTVEFDPNKYTKL